MDPVGTHSSEITPLGDTPPLVEEQEPIVLNEMVEVESYGKYTGSTKWFNDKLGYGFVTICDGDDKGKDIFVHHTGVKPLNSNYKTLRKGEYIQFNIINGINGLQAVDVTGIKGGPLMCDYVTSKRMPGEDMPIAPPGWQTIPVRTPRATQFGVAPPSYQPQFVVGVGLVGDRAHKGAPPSVPARPYKNTAKYNKATRHSSSSDA